MCLQVACLLVNATNQCDFASSQASNLKTHIDCGRMSRAALLSSRVDSSEPSKARVDSSGPSKGSQWPRENILPGFWLACKCNQCDFASSQASNLRTHVKRHTGDKWPLAERKREGENILPGFRSRSMLAGLLEEAATGQNWFANEFSHSLNSNPPTARSSFSQRKTPTSSHLNSTTSSLLRFELPE